MLMFPFFQFFIRFLEKFLVRLVRSRVGVSGV